MSTFRAGLIEMKLRLENAGRFAHYVPEPEARAKSRYSRLESLGSLSSSEKSSSKMVEVKEEDSSLEVLGFSLERKRALSVHRFLALEARI